MSLFPLRASIDIGSNSILLLIGEKTELGLECLVSESRVTALGRDLDKAKCFHQESMSTSLEVLREYVQIALKHRIRARDIIVTATEASRVASNARDFFEQVKQELDLQVNIITGEAEAFFTTKGILLGEPQKKDDLFILDIGGASTEIIQVNSKSGVILKSISMPIGAVRATAWLQEDVFNEKQQETFEAFATELEELKCKFLICVAGTMTSVANMLEGNPNFVEKKVHGLEFQASQVEYMMKLKQGRTPTQLLKEFPFLEKRAATIVGGLRVATAILNRLGVETLKVSTYGLRYGTILEGRIDDRFLAK